MTDGQRNIRLVFCADPLNKRQVDGMDGPEATAAGTQGLAYDLLVRRTEEQLAAEFARAMHGMPEADLRRWRQRGCVWPSPDSRVNMGLEPQVRSEPFRADQVRLSLRDRFTCRYCGRPTIFLPVLQLLAMRYPDVLRLEEAWRMPTNSVFWVYAASPEHRIPFKRGGTADVHNLLTACYDCQDRKSDWLLDELGWPGLDISSHDWKGFANIYEGLYTKLRPVVPTTKRRFFDDWLRAWKEGSSNSEPAA
jgi:5-methylcytosine-specific restriction endonuclease McrA